MFRSLCFEITWWLGGDEEFGLKCSKSLESKHFPMRLLLTAIRLGFIKTVFFSFFHMASCNPAVDP